MTRVSEITEYWFGLCRKPPAVHVPQMSADSRFMNACNGVPGSSDSGSGANRRGIGAALSGMRTLNRNRQLLWFTLSAGLVLSGFTIGQGALFYIDWIMSDEIVPLILTFFLDLATLFCLMFLLAGLIRSILSGKEGPASFLEGLSGAKKYLKAVFLWSLVLALAGMLADRVFFYPGGLFWPFDSSLLSLLIQFPFTLNLNPATFAEIPGYGGRSILFWTYPYGFENVLTFSAINLLLFILTPFVVPFIVLEHKTLRDAVAGSFAMMRKSWAEVAACTVFLGIIVWGVFLTFLLIQAAHGMVTPPELLYDRPTNSWLALGIVYYLALFSIAFVSATVGGIAVLDIYASAKTGQITGSPESEHHS